MLLVNAGYSYPAFSHYFDDPIAWQGRLTEWEPSAPLSTQGLTLLEGGSVDGSDSLGWGLPESDFYAMGADETITALERIAARSSRLWHFRLYDTVTDPDGLIRDWLDEHALLFYDQQLSGESNARVQGWYFPPHLGQAPDAPRSARFLSPDGSTTWVTVHGVDLPRGPQVGGSWVDFNLWLEGSKAMDPGLHLSLGLFDTTPAERQWAVLDEQPLGPLLSLNQLAGAQRWPVRLRLPQGIPPGKYEAHLKFYRPSDGATLPPQGENLAPPDRVRVAVVEIGPTPLSNRPPDVGTPQEARFGPLKFLGHAIPPGPWEPGASIPIELVWRVIEETEGDLGLFLTSNALSEDDGGVTQAYPTDEWHAGEIVRDIHYVTIAPNAAPGEYPIYLRVSRDASVIPWTHGLFRSGEILQLGTLTVQDRPRVFEPPQVATPLDVAFGDSIRLIGATLPPPDARFALGSEIPLTLNWVAEGRPPGRYKIFTHLIDEQGNLGPQRDLEPGEGRLPTNGWARGEYVSTAYTIPVPATIPPGRYQIRVGLYDAVTGERVPPFGANADSQNRFLLLGSVEVGP